MTKWKVLALIAVATLVPALTAAVVLADLPDSQRDSLLTGLSAAAPVLAIGLISLVGLIGAIAWRTWRWELRQDAQTAAQIRMISEVNPDHRLTGESATEQAVNELAERHAGAEARLQQALDAAHSELTLERDSLLSVLKGLDVPVGVVDDRGRILLVNPAARQALGGRTPIAAGRSILGVFDADDFLPLLAGALAGERPRAVVQDTAIRLVRLTGPEEPAMVLVVGDPSAEQVGPHIGLSADMSRPSRPLISREQWLQTPLADIVFTVVDCETTGLQAQAGDRLVAIGAVRVDGALVRADDTFDILIDPGITIPELSTSFHGITDAMVAGAPRAGAAIVDFAEYAQESVLVAHHAAFDLGFLRPAAAAAGVDLEPLHLDTMLLSAVLDPDPDARHGLDHVSRRYGVEIFGRHTALGDALATAEVLVRMIPQLRDRGIETLADARAASAATGLAKRMESG